MKAPIAAAILVTMISVSACAPAITANVQEIGENEVSTFTLDARSRTVTVRPNPDTSAGGPSYIVCGEPAPDVAVQSTINIFQELGLDNIFSQQNPANQGGLNFQNKVDIAEKVIELGVRSQSLMVQREALSRLCELNANGALSDARTFQLYDETLTTLRMFAIAEIMRARPSEDINTAVMAQLISATLENRPEPVVGVGPDGTTFLMSGSMPDPAPGEAKILLIPDLEEEFCDVSDGIDGVAILELLANQKYAFIRGQITEGEAELFRDQTCR